MILKKNNKITIIINNNRILNKVINNTNKALYGDVLKKYIKRIANI